MSKEPKKSKLQKVFKKQGIQKPNKQKNQTF